MLPQSLGLQRLAASPGMHRYHLPNLYEVIKFLIFKNMGDSFFYEQIAERGGHGASKNMIGTRGADKV